jgi:hypothetical protein
VAHDRPFVVLLGASVIAAFSGPDRANAAMAALERAGVLQQGIAC